MRKLCRSKIVAAVFVLCVVSPAYGDPTIQMVSSFLRLQGAALGERFTWIAMGRDASAHNVSLRIVRGLEPANAEGEYQFDNKLDPEHSVWLAAGVDASWVLPPRVAGCDLTSNVIEVAATAGATELVVTSTIVYGNYIRPGGSVWTFTATDGSAADDDATLNGDIVIKLSTLAKFLSSADLPTTIAAGDKLLLLDPHRLRAMTYEVIP